MTTLIERAVKIAHELHAGQWYGKDTPYVTHLADVARVIESVLVVTPMSFEPTEASDAELIAAAWLHDVLEDTPTTRVELTKLIQNHRVSALVWRVTDEAGNTRFEKHAATYQKIERSTGARILKLADRVANTEAAWRDCNPLLFMYYNEYRDFRIALKPRQVKDAREQVLWNRLDRLMGWKS